MLQGCTFLKGKLARAKSIPLATADPHASFCAMSKEASPEDLMHYEAMVKDALRGVVKAALKRAAASGGLPGNHHFYLTFKTHAPSVSLPPVRTTRPSWAHALDQRPASAFSIRAMMPFAI